MKNRMIRQRINLFANKFLFPPFNQSDKCQQLQSKIFEFQITVIYKEGKYNVYDDIEYDMSRQHQSQYFYIKG